MAAEKPRSSLGYRLWALAAFAIVLLLVARFVIRKERPLANENENENENDDADVVTLAPVSSATSSQHSRSHARYESALVDARIDGLSSGAGTALAVGEHGIILRYEIEHPSWRPEMSPTRVALHAVAEQLDEAIAVGDEGTILERDESGNWTQAAAITNRTLRAVVYTSYGAFAVGDGGTILHRVVRREPWRVEASGTKSDLFGACAGLRDVWVVGANGTILGRSIDAWKVQAIGAANLYAVACDDHGALAVGANGAMVERLDDVAWHASPSGVTADLFAVSAPIGTRSFLVAGASGAIVHVTQTASAEPQSVDFTFRAVSEGALGTWLAGDRGIYRRVPQ